jgi:hypothetical protein
MSQPDPSATDLVRVPGEIHPYEFHGRLVADVTTETDESPRWTEMELYRFTDGTGRYLVHIAGRSVVYHEHDSMCNAGSPTTRDQLLEDAEPCPRCRPDVRGQDDTYVIDAESDRHSVTVCEAATDVLQALRLPGRRGYSAPAQRLLERAKLADQGFAAATSLVERL